jgi:hypothetical protein
MEDRIEELEQYTRREDIIISGLKPEYHVCGKGDGRIGICFRFW